MKCPGPVLPILILAGCTAAREIPLSSLASTDALLQTGCSKLTNTLGAQVERMKLLRTKAKSEQEAPPPDLLSAFQRSFSATGAGVATLEALAEERKRADEINAALHAKGCQTVDIDAALRSSAPSPTAETP